MKIAVNATIVDPASSGLGIYTINLTRELIQLHKEIIVYTSTPEFFAYDGIEVHGVRTTVRPSRGFRGHISRVVWSQMELPKHLRASAASVLLSPTPLEGLLRSSVPQVLVIHDLLPLRYPDLYPRQKYYFRYVVPRLIARSRCVVAVSETTKREIISRYGISGERVTVVHNGCDHKRFYPAEVQTKRLPERINLPYLLYVGNLFPHKNLHRLLDAFALIAGNITHQLVLVGSRDPRYYPGLVAKARLLGIEERVCFLDYVPSDSLPNLYRQADWFILPSLFEGFGMTAIEAMACGTPVIVSNTAALEETVGDAGVYVNPVDSSDIAKKILSACHDASLRCEMRGRSIKRASRYTWSTTAQKMLDVLKEASRAHD